MSIRFTTGVFILLSALTVALSSCGVEPTQQKIFYSDAAFLGFSSGGNVWRPLLTSIEYGTDSYHSLLGVQPEFGILSKGRLNADTTYNVDIVIGGFTDRVDTFDIQDDNMTIRFRLYHNDVKVFDRYMDVGQVTITDIDTARGKRHFYGEFSAELDSRNDTPAPRIAKGFFDCRFSGW